MVNDNSDTGGAKHFRIADLSNDDKPREKALRHGIRALSDTELIAILLGGGVPGKSVIELSRELYGACGQSLSAMAKMSVRDMCRKFHGIGPAKAVTIAAALELGARRNDVREQKPVIKCAADAYNLIIAELGNLTTEEFWVLMLSRANRLIGKERISSGGTASTVVDTKIVIKRAIEHMADAIILVHNHPSGNLRPSAHDDTITRKIKEAGALLDITVHDHIIVCDTGFYSYADEGLL